VHWQPILVCYLTSYWRSCVYFQASFSVRPSIRLVDSYSVVTASSIYAASVTTFLPSASISGASPTAGVITIPLSSYSFTPYPTPSLAPHPPVFPATDPLNPPDVIDDGHVVPDFAPAWATAYQKARNLVSAPVLTLNHLYFDCLVCRFQTESSLYIHQTFVGMC
jgi:hypothetical protein